MTTNPKQQGVDTKDVDLDPTQEYQRYIAEILHIIRPVCHCKIDIDIIKDYLEDKFKTVKIN